MTPRRVLALSTAASAVLMGIPAAAGAQNGAARLEGTFALSGRVTVAVHIKGEHRGQHVVRVWSFTPLCPSGACPYVVLTRQRAGGTDTLTLSRVAPGYYRGQSAFAAPLGCGGQPQPSGEMVRFTITVRITATSSSADGLIASHIKARYTNRVRLNSTPCVFPPSHDAAVYRGTLTSTAPTASAQPSVSLRSPAGS